VKPCTICEVKAPPSAFYKKEILRKCFKKWSKIEHSRRIMSKRRSTKNKLVVKPKLATRAVIRIGFFLYGPDAAGCHPSYLRPAVRIVLVSPTKKKKTFICVSQHLQYLDAIKSSAKDLSLPIFETLIGHASL
jgi:phage pi2 protein 07